MASYLEDGAYRLKCAHNGIERELVGPNKEYALEFEKWLRLNSKAKTKNALNRTLARRLEEARQVLRLVGRDARLATRKDIEHAVLEIKEATVRDGSKDMSLSSRARLLLTLKVLYKMFDGNDDYPALVKWIKVPSPPSTKRANDLLTMDEMIRLIDACPSPRTKAIFSVFSTFGCRLSELLSLSVGSITVSKEGPNWIHFTGKTGERDCPWYPNSLCGPYLTAWLNLRHAKGKDEPLFLSESEPPHPLDYKNIRRMVQRLKETGVVQKRRLHIHLWRFSVARHLKEDLAWSDQTIKDYMGWSRRSRMLDEYNVGGRDELVAAVARAAGDKGKVREPPKTAKLCPKCGMQCPITDTYCPRCSTPLDADVKQDIGELAQLRADVADLKEIVSLLSRGREEEAKKIVQRKG